MKTPLLNPVVETDPQKIAERLEQTRQARLKYRPNSYAEAASQIQAHARSVRPSSAKSAGKSNASSKLPSAKAA